MTTDEIGRKTDEKEVIRMMLLDAIIYMVIIALLVITPLIMLTVMKWRQMSAEDTEEYHAYGGATYTFDSDTEITVFNNSMFFDAIDEPLMDDLPLESTGQPPMLK